MLGIRSFIALLLCLATPSPAFAFVRTMSASGRPLAWVTPSISVRANPANSSGLSEAQVSTTLSAAYSAWQVPGTRVGFSYSQSTGNPAASAIDGINASYFVSQSGQQLDWGVVALTEVIYDVSSGQIREADTAFNDNQFLFTTNPGDTGHVVNNHVAIYLQDVATHEAGHVLGLDHSLINLASLIYTAFSGQYFLSEDDSNAIRTVYPAGAPSGGSFTGSVNGTEGGIFGAHLVAVNLLTGKVEAGALASSDGSFRLGDVPSGKYAVMMEPFGNSVSSVSGYYENVSHRFCSGSLFRRRFYSACDSLGSVSVLDASAGSSVGMGTLAPSCSAMGNPGGAPDSAAAAKELPSDGGAAWGTMNPGDTHFYVVHGVTGALSARVMSFSLYSPVDVKVEITDLGGTPVAGGTSVDNVANPGPGGITNYDSLATANVTSGDYLLKITSSATRIPPNAFPDGYELEDMDGHYLVSLAVNGEIAASPGATDMSACVSVPNVPQSATYSNSPSQSQPATSGCGSLRNEGGGPFGGGMSQVLSVAFLLQLLSVALRLRRRRAYSRSPSR